MILSEDYFATRGVGVSPADFCPNNGFNFAAHRYCLRSNKLIDVLGTIPEWVYNVQPIDRLRAKDNRDNKYYYLLHGILGQMHKELEDDGFILDDEQSVDGNKILSTLYLLSSLCYIVTKSELTGYESILATKNETILNMAVSNAHNVFLHPPKKDWHEELLNCCTITSEELRENTLNFATISQYPGGRFVVVDKGSLDLENINDYYILPYYMMRLRFLDVITRIGSWTTVISYMRDGRKKQIKTMFNSANLFDSAWNKAKYDCSKIVVRNLNTGLYEEINLLEITDIHRIP